MYVAGWEAEEATCVFIVEVGPAEKAAIIAFGDAGDMAVKHFVGKAFAERVLMLFLIAGNGVAGPDTGGPVPDHIIVPGFGQQIRRAAILAALVQAREVLYHGIDQIHCLGAVFGRVGIKQQAVMGLGAGIDKGHAGHRGVQGFGPMADLVHDGQDIAKQGRLCDLAVFDPVELGVAQHGDFAVGGNAEPILVEKPHEIAGIDDPDAVLLLGGLLICAFRCGVGEVGPGKEHIHAALHRGEAVAERGPEALDRVGCALLFVERVHAAPVIIGRGVLGEDRGQIVDRGRVERGDIIADDLFFGLETVLLLAHSVYYAGVRGVGKLSRP